MTKPTNAWFANLLYGQGNLQVATLPYHMKVYAAGLNVCLPALNTAAFPTAILADWADNIQLKATVQSTAQKVTGFTDLGCTVTWTVAGGAMVSDLVRGQAYVTMRYTSLVPVISTIHTFNQVNGVDVVGGAGTYSGTKFKVALNNGQTWIIYTSSTVTLNLTGSQVFTFGTAFTGTVRVAYLPSTSGAEAALDLAAPCIPTGGAVTRSWNGSALTKTMAYTTTGTGTLLTYAMPHHQDKLTAPTYANSTVGSLRGSMRGVLGSTWTLGMTIPTVGWDNKNAVQASRLAAVTTALNTDQNFVPVVNDPYFGGKQLAKAGRLVCIAHVLGNTSARDKLLAGLKNVMTQYITGQLATKLRYETNNGSVVSEAGLTNTGVDFGNGAFNDHYFHYGYTIYAAAVIARFDANWANQYKAYINDLCRDIASYNAQDPYFTKFRHFDEYEGHSWASGWPDANDGRNQESTSEAVNAWYGVQQWGVATNQSDWTMVGQALMTEEIITAQKYWQIKQNDTSVYPASAFKQRGVTGILWVGKADYGTWFSAAAWCIFGIQMLPTNPTTEALIDPAWMQEVWTNNISGFYNGAEEAWKGPLVGAWGQVNSADGWTKVQAHTATGTLDDGTSATQMLYHVATQP